MKCSLRYRAFYQDNSCPLCKVDLPTVVAIGVADQRSFEDFPTAVRQQLTFEKVGSMYLSTPEAEEVVRELLHTFNCPVCKAASSSLPELKKHLSATHGKVYCDVCLRHRKVFLPHQSVYTAGKGLKTHMKHGDKDDLEAPRGHSLCPFCNKYFYGIDEHYEHMTDAHEECQMCRMHGKLYQFFADYQSLETHFGNDHFLCREQNCLNDRYVVFATENELKAHNIAFHLTSRKLSRREERALRQLQLDLTYSSASPASSSSSSSSAELERLRYEQERQAEQLRMMEMEEMKRQLKIRNDEVVARMLALIGEDRYTHFKGSSKLFLQGTMTATEFYDLFIKTFGPANADSLFEGVIELLPAQFSSRAQALRAAKTRAEQRRSEFPSLSAAVASAPKYSSSNLSYLNTLIGPAYNPNTPTLPVTSSASSSSSSPSLPFGTTVPSFAETAARSPKPPSTIQIIPARSSTSSPTPAAAKAPAKSGPPPKDAFPVLAGPPPAVVPTWGPAAAQPKPAAGQGKKKRAATKQQHGKPPGFTVIEPVFAPPKPSIVPVPKDVNFHECFRAPATPPKPPASTTKRKSKRGETILSWG